MLLRAASLVAAVLAASLVLLACGGGGGGGGGGNASPVDAGAYDASVDAAAPDGDSSIDDGGPTTDALPDGDQDPNVYPAMHHPLPLVDRGPGPLLTHPKLVTVTFAGDANRDAYRAFDQAIGATSWWQSTLVPYGISPSQVVGEVELPDTLSGTMLSDAMLQSYLATQIQSGALPAPDAETLYVIYPTQTTSVTGPKSPIPSCVTGLDGYHYNFDVASPPPDGGTDGGGTGPNVTTMYAVVFNCGGPNTTVASHEIAEACTDPTPATNVAYNMVTNAAWPEASGGEVGDLCIALPGVTEGGYALQRVYSNAAVALDENPCQPEAATYFAAAVRTQKSSLYGDFLADGFVFVAASGSTDVFVDVFSDAPLPSDISLSAGSIRYSDGMATFVPSSALTLSRTTAHNGDLVVLTIAGAHQPGSSYLSIVRAQLATGETNDWPFIVVEQ